MSSGQFRFDVVFTKYPEGDGLSNKDVFKALSATCSCGNYDIHEQNGYESRQLDGINAHIKTHERNGDTLVLIKATKTTHIESRLILPKLDTFGD